MKRRRKKNTADSDREQNKINSECLNEVATIAKAQKNRNHAK